MTKGRSSIASKEKEQLLSARTKLNAVAVGGSILIAALVGIIFGSWIAFLIAATVLIAIAVHEGDIRSGRRRR